MLLYFPKKFDENEWTIIIAVIISILLFVLLPKRFPKEITPLIVLLSISFPKILDHSIAAKSLNLYNLNDMKQYEIFDVILYAVYPIFGYLFVYILDRYDIKKFKLVWYIVFWTFLGFGTDSLLVKLNVFNYTGWRLIYSLPVYITVLSVTYLFFQFIMQYYNKRYMN